MSSLLKGVFGSSSSAEPSDTEAPPAAGKPAADELTEYMDEKDLSAIGSAHFGKYMAQYPRQLSAALLPMLMCKAPFDRTSACMSVELWKDVFTLAVAPRLAFILLLAANIYLGAAGAVITFDLLAVVYKPTAMLIYAAFLAAVTLGWTHWYSPLIGALCTLGYAFACLREVAAARVVAIPFAVLQARLPAEMTAEIAAMTAGHEAHLAALQPRTPHAPSRAPPARSGVV